MANRQTYIVGALGVLAGMVVGANSAQSAQMLSFSGSNPNRVGQTVDRTQNILRTRSTIDGAYYVPSRSVPFAEGYIGHIRENRKGTVHSAAPTIRGGETMLQVGDPECPSIKTTRGARCNYYRSRGYDFNINYFVPSYE